MAPKFKVLVFSLGGILIDWDRYSVNALSLSQLLAIMNSTTWHNLERGKVSLKEACRVLGGSLKIDPCVVETALEQAQQSLVPNVSLIKTIHDLKAWNPDIRFYILSNISREHFEIAQNLNLPWSLFNKIFVSGVEGMRKPDLCFFQKVIKEAGVHPSEMIMIEDKAENICAARSQGMYGIFVDKSSSNIGSTLRNLLQDPLERAKVFLKNNARHHHCLIEGHEEIRLKDNFTQLMIWELTGDEDIVYCKWPCGKMLGSKSVENHLLKAYSNESSNGYEYGRLNIQSNSQSYNSSFVTGNVKDGLWNYFIETPVLTTRDFPPDADTTSTAYLSLPEPYLSFVPEIELVLDEMARYMDSDGIMQTYFDNERPRTVPEVCCNILRVFHRFGYGCDPRIKQTEDYVVLCLNNNACLDGSRHYSTPETFLYFVARLYTEIGSEVLRKRLSAIKAKLQERLDVPTNALALALRLFACQAVGIETQLYKKDLERLISLQGEDGGWPAGHFCRLGRTGTRIGNRGLTTALAIRILQHVKLKA